MKTSAPQASSPRVVGGRTVLAGILLVALLQNPSPAFSALPAGPSSVTLAWDSSVGPNVAGYRVYYGWASGYYTGSMQVGNVTTSTIPGLIPGVTYFFAVTAYNLAGVESLFSNEVQYTPGIPTLRLGITSNREAVLTVRGLAGQTCEIEVTQDFKVWTAIGTVVLGPDGSGDFFDLPAATGSSLFYRAHGL